MTGVFGPVADAYDEVRPGYPAGIGPAVLAYHGGVPTQVVELGAGTGKGTEILAALGAPLLCVEPDERMAAVLRAKFPRARIHPGTFEEWPPPPGGVPMIACAMAWHWFDEATRNQRVHAALAPGGTLAVFGHRYDYADPAQGLAISAALRSVDPTLRERAVDWFHTDIERSGVFTDVRAETFGRHLELSRQRYLRLVQTFSPFLKRSARLRAEGLAAVGAALDRFGGGVVLDLRTTLVLARRPG